MGVPGVVPAAGEILQPHPGLVIDADVQLVLRGRIELLIVIGEPLGAVSVNDGVVRRANTSTPPGARSARAFSQ